MGVGDNLIHNVIFEEAQLEDGTFDFKPMFENVAEEIETADLAFINQETLIGGDDFGFSGYPAFNTPSDMSADLNELGFDLVNGASNHSLDKGRQGVVNTLDIWDKQEDMVFTGVFDSQEERDAIPVIERDGVTFSFLAYTYGTNGIEPDVSYRLNYFDEALITQDIERAKKVSDFVIVSAHWGDEHMLEPNEFQKKYAQLFADLEVDAVIG
ncbi:MAG: CapA family protein, partial [Carnobacterium jeotgali]